MKSENKSKRKGIKVLPALGDKNLAKRMVENDKKMGLEPWPSRIEREKVENFLKKWVWTRENQFLKNSLHNFRSIEK